MTGTPGTGEQAIGQPAKEEAEPDFADLEEQARLAAAKDELQQPEPPEAKVENIPAETPVVKTAAQIKAEIKLAAKANQQAQGTGEQA